MSNVDWSLAPEGATHWAPETEDWLGGFRKKSEDGFQFWVTDHWGPINCYGNDYLSMMVSKPETEEPRADAHYNNVLRLPVTQADADAGYIEVKLDPYLVQRTCNVTDPVLQHIHKKAQRGTSKGHSMLELLTEIKQSAERGIELERLV